MILDFSDRGGIIVRNLFNFLKNCFARWGDFGYNCGQLIIFFCLSGIFFEKIEGRVFSV